MAKRLEKQLFELGLEAAQKAGHTVPESQYGTVYAVATIVAEVWLRKGRGRSGAWTDRSPPPSDRLLAKDLYDQLQLEHPEVFYYTPVASSFFSRLQKALSDLDVRKEHLQQIVDWIGDAATVWKVPLPLDALAKNASRWITMALNDSKYGKHRAGNTSNEVAPTFGPKGR